MKTTQPDEAIVERLPRTFAPAMREQLARREVLFPAEQRLLENRLEWLRELTRSDFDRLFAPVKALESRMTLPHWRKGESRFSIEDTAILARSPLYAEWRAEVEKVFAVIDAGAEKLGRAKFHPRLLFCVLPAGLPPAPEPWNDVPGGARVPLTRPFAEIQPELLGALSRRSLPADLETVEGTWVLACESGPFGSLPDAVVLCWDRTTRLRREFLDKLNSISKALKSADEAIWQLERTDMTGLLAPELVRDPRVREFLRTLLLSGNGSLVFNNSFVQWGASEALRRAQPQVLIASFGIRTKPKPFSSIVLFEDQTRRNPTSDQPDLDGSRIDGEILSRYVHLTAERLAPYAGRTLTLFAVADRNYALAVFPDRDGRGRREASAASGNLVETCLHWLETP
jgi:hypothetical protein